MCPSLTTTGRATTTVGQLASRETKAKVADVLSSATRRKAWALADGTRTQREIAKQSALDEGTTSKMFKLLRELGAITGTNPEHTLEIS